VRVQTQPTVIYIHSRSSDSLIQSLEQPMELIPQCKIVKTTSQKYNLESSKDQIKTLLSLSNHVLEFKLSCNQNKESVACVSNLLDYAQENRVKIIDISLVTLNEFMYVNEDALLALSLFDSKDHPNMHSFTKKEKDSLFALYEPKTSIGKLKLFSWFLKPLQSIDLIKKRQKIVKLLQNVDNNRVNKLLLKVVNILVFSD
jgi:DNA mismatch repair ATPase MutS